MITGEDLIAIALESNAANAAVIETARIAFYEEFRTACAQNVCGKYDTNWMGPPAIGSIRELKERVLHFAHGLLFQSTHPLASNFDWKGMMAGAQAHTVIFHAIMACLRRRYPTEEFLPLNAGCCSECARCAYQDAAPCRHPDRAVSSVEAYGMNVIGLQKMAGLRHYHGKTTVCYVGLILFGPRGAA